MRLLTRLSLPRETRDYLRKLTGQIHAALHDSSTATRLWRGKNKRRFQPVRDTLRQMASGLERCMYCEDSVGTDIDHFWPRSRYPRKTFEWENFLLACSRCNSNEKRSQFPLDALDMPLLVDPTSEDPRAHFDLTPYTGKYEPLSPKGTESIRVFNLNYSQLEKARLYAWFAFELFIVVYDRAMEAGDDRRANDIKNGICCLPQSGVLLRLLDVAESHSASKYLGFPCRMALANRPEIAGWIT